MKIAIAAALALAALTAQAGAQDLWPPPEELLPSIEALQGWRTDGELLVFGPDDLWEYINGQAESFLRYDFIEVAARHFASGDSLEIKVEIYRHGSPLMAWGVYTQFRSPGAAFLDIGVEGFGDEYSLLFWKGPYYVRVQTWDEGEAGAAAMRLFAGLVAGAVRYDGGEPAETAVFPPGGLVSRSLSYVTEGVMGSGKLPEAFVADYRRGGEEGRLYLFPLEHEEDAGMLLEWYAGEIGAEMREGQGGGAAWEIGEGEAPYRGRVVLFRQGRWMGVAAGFGAGGGEGEVLAAEAAALTARFDAE
ncbi:MAG: hypothetical protein PHQ19_07480 [Candidatus Krumholzibacteria bacterium]|nr:hypothetical protein [Candidatus Krumholzibacteria bacterium]